MLRFSLIAVLFTIVFFQILGEKVPVNEGTMGDGLFYREVAGDFLGDIEEGQYDFLQIQRVMPFAIVNSFFEILQFAKSNQNLLRGMLVAQFLFLGLGVYWYFSLGSRLRLADALTVFGFLMVFANFAVLKNPWYNPFSSDLPTLVFALGQVNYFVRGNRQKLFLISIIGGFVWPTMLLSGLLLTFLPREPLVIKPSSKAKSFFPLAFSSALLIIIFLSSFASGRLLGPSDQWSVMHAISIFTVSMFVFLIMVKNPIDWNESFSLFCKKVSGLKISKLIFIWLSFAIILFLLSGSNQNINPLKIFDNYFGEMLRFPLDFLVGHLLFFGFLIPLTLVFFPRVMKETAKLGMGFTAVCIVMFIFFLHPESRLLNAFMPMLVLVLLKSIRRYNILTKDIAVFGIVNLLLSAFWFELNVSGMDQMIDSISGEILSRFPAQRYWMHFGHKMSMEVYFIFGLMFSVLVYVVWKGKERYKRESIIRMRSHA